jgi:hypothetical protein
MPWTSVACPAWSQDVNESPSVLVGKRTPWGHLILFSTPRRTWAVVRRMRRAAFFILLVCINVCRDQSQSVSRSVRLGVQPLRDSWPDFGCRQDGSGFVCHGAFSLSRGRVCHVTGHSPCLCQAIYTLYIMNLFKHFYSNFSFIFHSSSSSLHFKAHSCTLLT